MKEPDRNTAGGLNARKSRHTVSTARTIPLCVRMVNTLPYFSILSLMYIIPQNCTVKKSRCSAITLISKIFLKNRLFYILSFKQQVRHQICRLFLVPITRGNCIFSPVRRLKIHLFCYKYLLAPCKAKASALGADALLWKFVFYTAAADGSFTSMPNIAISSSTFVMPPIPKFSTRTFATFGERNAGSVGPR